MQRRFVDYLRTDDEAGANISWSAIFAGVVTFIAVFITLSFIGSAIGFGLLEPTSNDPINGAGTGVLVWSVIAFFLSFLAAGFVAGLTSKRVGMVHGFLTWATTTLVLVVLVSQLAISALSGATSLIGSAAGVAGKGVSAVASAAGDAVTTSVEGIVSNVDVDIDTNELQANVEKYLRDTDQPELQPDYLKGQLAQSKDEITDAAKKIAANPANASDIIKSTAQDLKDRAAKIGKNVDRDALAASVAKNSELSEAEAKQSADQIYDGYQKAVAEAQKAIDTASDKMTELSNKAKQTIADARQGAENVTGATSSASIWGFIGMLLAMIASSGMGVVGARVGANPKVQKRM